jgi:transcriptional regulator with XRE-family HTH domain
LRREELALLAGVSSSYYTRLEQGQSRNASPQVLDAIATALQLDDAERQHLRTLGAALDQRAATKRAAIERVAPALTELLAALDDVPAVVLGRRSDVLAWNALGHALLAGHIDIADAGEVNRRPNMAELVFLDEHCRDLYVDCVAKERAIVGNLRLVSGQHPDDPALASLVGRLTMASPDFAAMWADHRVRACASARYEMRHPLVGTLTVTQQTLRSVDVPDQSLVTCTTERDSPSSEALVLLAHIIRNEDRSPNSRIRQTHVSQQGPAQLTDDA